MPKSRCAGLCLVALAVASFSVGVYASPAPAIAAAAALEMSCQVGGPGSASCSANSGGCSIECPEGKYACCVGSGENSTCNCATEMDLENNLL